MAWSNPPTFASGAILSATSLNALSDDIEYLYGFVSGANPALTSVLLDIDGDAMYIVRHMHRYLWCRYDANADVKIYYSADGVNWTQVYHDGAPQGVANGEQHVVDLNSYNFAVGQLYQVKCALNSNSGHRRLMHFVFESDVAS